MESQSVRFGEEINLLLPPRFERQPLQLRYPGYPSDKSNIEIN